METGLPAETFLAKRLLSPVRYPEDAFFLADYNINLYRGCNHGCIYCDTRSECYRIERFDHIRHKKDCLAMLEQELRQKKKPGVVAVGAASDPYNRMEKDLEITRQSLLLLKKYGFGAGLTTKGTLMARDADVLADMGKTAPVYGTFSITAAEDALSLRLEPGAPPTSQRFAAMKELAQAGVFVGTWICPVVPFLTDSWDNLEALLEKTAEAGGRYAVCHFGMTLRTGNREYFYAHLDKDPSFQGIKQKFVDAFGLQYSCVAPQAEALRARYEEACARRGLLHRFTDINRAARAGCPTQLALF